MYAAGVSLAPTSYFNIIDTKFLWPFLAFLDLVCVAYGLGIAMIPLLGCEQRLHVSSVWAGKQQLIEVEVVCR